MKDWRFISNQNSTISGINDAGIETFTANIHRSLVRESIQNSLDAAITDFGKPVEVDFSLMNIPRENFPGIEVFQGVINKCYKSNEMEPDAKRFFKNADKIIKGSDISILRISDHNTIGLEGSDTCAKGTSWSRLVKESGSSNKGQSSGGSFGIGKSAAFACSDLRTVFYSSLDTKGLRSSIGVAKLVSFEDKNLGGWTTGVGYYSKDDRFVAIPELLSFDDSYNRKDSGTDIYIIGAHLSDDSKDVFIKSVLLDFLVALVKGQLIVRVQNDIISKETLAKHMRELNPYENEEIKELLDYYHLLTSNDTNIIKIPLNSNIYGEKYGFNDNECTLYIKEAEGYNRKILITRRAGMKIFEQNRISGSIEFTGVLIIDGPNMNEAFKKMEVPSHDAWEPGRCRGEEKRYTDILTRVKAVELTEVELADTGEEGGGEYEGKGNGGKGKHKGKGIGDGDRGGTNRGEENGLKQISVKKRLMCEDASNGIYTLSMTVPSTASIGKINFELSGEQSEYELPIVNASILSKGSSTVIDKFKGNTVYLKNLRKGECLKIEIKVSFDKYCMMEVDYYAKKR